MLDELGFEYEVIDITEKIEYLQKYTIYIAPGIIINGKLEFTGIPKKEELVKKLIHKNDFPNGNSND